MIVDRCSSTNELAKELGQKGSPHGTWISAKSQSAGRGRQGRTWESAEGNLFVSLVLRPSSPETLWTWLPIAVGLASLRAIEKLGVEAKLKWPNDLYANGKKLGGVLCEASQFVVAGVGINVISTPDTPNLRAPAICLADINAGAAARLDELRADLVSQVTESTRAIDPRVIREEFLYRSLYRPGQSLSWSGRSGRFLGLGEFGEALIADDAGKAHALFSEDLDPS